ncbi:unnamed protein product, partial [Tetraodon nigroviridis]
DVLHKRWAWMEEGRGEESGNLCKTQENRQGDIFTKTETFRKLIRDRHIREISKVGEKGW